MRTVTDPLHPQLAVMSQPPKEMVDAIARRLRPTCSHMSEPDFARLVADAAAIQHRHEQRALERDVRLVRTLNELADRGYR